MSLKLLFIIIGIAVYVVILASFFMIKNYVTYNNHIKITNAIYKRAKHFIDLGDFDEAHKVDYNDMEDYEYTLFRLWDWSCKHILPREKFDLIKDYIDFID